VSSMAEILRQIVSALTRYSANDPELPVNDLPLFTGCKAHVNGGGTSSCGRTAQADRGISGRIDKDSFCA
jgi:hypothetical protein